jgi:hypothetical protein
VALGTLSGISISGRNEATALLHSRHGGLNEARGNASLVNGQEFGRGAAMFLNPSILNGYFFSHHPRQAEGFWRGGLPPLASALPIRTCAA